MSTIVPTYPLLVDSALYNDGSNTHRRHRLGNWQTPLPPTGEAVEWTDAVGVGSGGSLTKTAVTGWGNAGAASRQVAGVGGRVGDIHGERDQHIRMLGLNDGDSDRAATPTGLRTLLDRRGERGGVQSGVYRESVGSYSSGDWFQLAVVSGATPQVQYLRNGVVFYMSTIVPAYPLLVDSTLYSTAATLTNATVSGNWE